MELDRYLYRQIFNFNILQKLNITTSWFCGHVLQDYVILRILCLKLKFPRIYSPFHIIIYRSSHRRCSIRKGVLKNSAKFTGKRLSRDSGIGVFL